MASEATRQHELIQQKHSELVTLAKSIDEGCDIVKREWDVLSTENSSAVDSLDKSLAKQYSSSEEMNSHLLQCIADLKSLKALTTKSLFSVLLKYVSQLQSRIQDLSNKIAALKEGIIVQEQKVSQIATIRALPEAYEAGLKEADRRRSFSNTFSAKVQQVSDFIAKERDKELQKRESFQRSYGRVLPPDLIPGLIPWVFPTCEVTQRPIDPALFSNVLIRENASSVQEVKESPVGGEGTGELLFGPESTSGTDRAELDTLEALEIEAENEVLKGNNEGSALAAFKAAHEKELDMLKSRIAELEAHLSRKSNDVEAETRELRPNQSNDDSPEVSLDKPSTIANVEKEKVDTAQVIEPDSEEDIVKTEPPQGSVQEEDSESANLENPTVDTAPDDNKEEEVVKRTEDDAVQKIETANDYEREEDVQEDEGGRVQESNAEDVE